MSKLINKKSIALGKVLLVTLAFLALIVVVSPKKATAQYEEGYDTGYDGYMYQSPNPIPVMGSISPSSIKAGDNITAITITGNGFTANSVARWNGQNRNTTFIDRKHVIINLNPGDLNSSGGYINVYNPNRQEYSTAVKLKISGYTVSNTNNTNNNQNNQGGNTGMNGGPNTGYNNGGNTGGNNYNNSFLSYTNTGDSNSTRNTNGSYSSNENQNESNNSDGQNIGSLASGAIFGSNSFAPSGIVQWVLFAIIILLIVIIVRKFLGGADRYHNTPLKHA